MCIYIEGEIYIIILSHCNQGLIMHCEYPHFAPLYGSNPQRVVDEGVDIVDNDRIIWVDTTYYWAPTCERT